MSTKVRGASKSRSKECLKEGPDTNRLAVGVFCSCLPWIREEQLAGLIVGIFHSLSKGHQHSVVTAISPNS